MAKIVILCAIIACAFAAFDADYKAVFQAIKDNNVAIYGRTTCGLTTGSHNLLTAKNITHFYDTWDNKSNATSKSINNALWAAKSALGEPSSGSVRLPFTFVCGKYIGSYDNLSPMVNDGSLVKKLADTKTCKAGRDAVKIPA